MDEVITLEHVSKRLGERDILKDVNLDVKRGDIFGYLGPNGAGKTTSIRIILGLFSPTSGKAQVLGQDSQEAKVRQKIGFILEADGLYDNLSAYDNLAYYAQIYDVAGASQRIKTVIGLVGLSDRMQDKAGNFSKGMRQRLALARGMLHNPEVLVLDEPTAGVDPGGQIEIRQIMLDMVKKEGKTILLSSHNLDEVQRICNRIALIHKGEIRLAGELDKLQHQMSHGQVNVETTDPVPPPIIAELNASANVRVNAQHERNLILTIGEGKDISGIVALLSARGVKIEQFKKQEASLEEIYTTILKEAEHKEK
jgi:ABC-2 type transport system ATP-binding protein